MGTLTRARRDAIHISSMAVAPRLVVRPIDIKSRNLPITQRGVLISSWFGWRSKVPAGIQGPFRLPALPVKRGIKCSLEAPGGDYIFIMAKSGTDLKQYLDITVIARRRYSSREAPTGLEVKRNNGADQWRWFCRGVIKRAFFRWSVAMKCGGLWKGNSCSSCRE